VTPDKVKVLIAMLFAVLAVSFGEALLAKGMKQSSDLQGSIVMQAFGVIRNTHIIGGIVLMLVYFGLYMLSLRWADLSFVLPLTALSYMLGAFLARFYLHETVTPTRWIGAMVIMIGVIIVGLGDAGVTPLR
jgi:drug/metabolite transporter (DMT)-like permease